MSTSVKAMATKIYTIRFTPDEFAKLKDLAANARMTVAEYIRDRLFGEEVEKRKRVIRAVIQDADALSKIFSLLGATHIASNLNQIAKSVNQGALSLSPDKEAALLKTCVMIAEIRDLACQQ